MSIDTSTISARFQFRGNEIVGNPYNAALVLGDHPAFAGMLGWDEFHDQVVLWHEVPAEHGDMRPPRRGEPRPLDNIDLTAITEALNSCGLVKLSEGVVFGAVHRIARRRPYHPVKVYLEGLIWDGVERLGRPSGASTRSPGCVNAGAEPPLGHAEAVPSLESPLEGHVGHAGAVSWLTRYFGAEDGEYTRTVGRAPLLAMIARIYEPGCKFDYLTILEGVQGAKKSTCVSILASPWFSDSLPCDITSKDASIALKGLWGVEIGELSVFKKAEVEDLKRFISRTAEKYRPPYAKLEILQPRSCVFWGTTNDDTYLTDATGNRRFFPVRVKKLDEEALRADRDQLMAEALVAYRKGEPWWVGEEFEEKFARAEQAARMVEDPWQGKVSIYVKNRNRLTYSQIFESALGIETKDLNGLHKSRMARVMSALGWKFLQVAGTKVWVSPTREESPGVRERAGWRPFGEEAPAA